MLDEYVGEIRNDLPTKMRSGPSQPTRHRRRCRPKSRQRSSRDWRVVALIVLIASSFGSESAQGFEGNRGHRPSTRNIDDSSLRGEEGRQQRKNRTNDSAISGSAPHDDSFPVPRRTLRILRHRVVRRSVNIVEGVRTRSTNSQSGGSAFVHPWSCRTIRGGALQPPNVVDRLARSWALFLAWVVSFQTLRSAVRYHKEFLLEVCGMIPFSQFCFLPNYTVVVSISLLCAFQTFKNSLACNSIYEHRKYQGSPNNSKNPGVC